MSIFYTLRHEKSQGFDDEIGNVGEIRAAFPAGKQIHVAARSPMPWARTA
jgi:hypothetical protein